MFSPKQTSEASPGPAAHLFLLSPDGSGSADPGPVDERAEGNGVLGEETEAPGGSLALRLLALHRRAVLTLSSPLCSGSSGSGEYMKDQG